MNIENNKIIAEFISIESPYYKGHYICPNGIATEPKDMRFDTDWNWLMSVVEKIFKDFYKLNPCPIGLKMEIEEQLIQVDKQAVYNACIEYINWYNENKKLC